MYNFEPGISNLELTHVPPSEHFHPTVGALQGILLNVWMLRFEKKKISNLYLSVFLIIVGLQLTSTGKTFQPGLEDHRTGSDLQKSTGAVPQTFGSRTCRKVYSCNRFVQQCNGRENHDG
jgi:hypothetical protein